MSLALKARQKARRKGGSKERVFGCDLLEHLQQSGQDVPQVLRSCTQFVEQHGVVDGIYRLSGVSSNIQRLRQEFDGERCPDLQRDVYLQDIHCVSSLCKAYFRELPNPLLTYQLYDKFADAVAIQMEEARLVKIKEVLKELPPPHYRTLEFLMRHLLLMASHSSRTNMHARNLAIVWAPNLLRSRDIEATGFNGTAAFMEVRVQSIVVEFILTHVEQLFGDAPLRGAESPRRSLLLLGTAGGLPAGEGQPPPFHVPAALSQGDGPPPIRPYHTIIELGEHRRKGSLKGKKWRSIFHLGRSSHEAKRKLGKAEEKDEKGGKISLRPAKSMDSLSSVPDDEPRLSAPCPAKQPPQRRESFDTCPTAPGQAPGEPLVAAVPTEGPEGDGSSSQSEPSTPSPGRAALGTPGRSPSATRGRAEKCAGVHISGPFSVTVPFHITANLSRLTRGLPCPALAPLPASPPPAATRHDDGDPQQHPGAAEQRRLSLELRDSFAFLDSPETWLEGGGDGGMGTGALPMDSGDGDSDDGGVPAAEEGMESGCMNPGEPPAAPPATYLSIEECMDEELFFLAPGEAEAGGGDSDSDDMFLSAHDELSPLVPLSESPVGTAPESPPPGLCPEEEEEEEEEGALGDPSRVLAEHPGLGGVGQGAAGGGRTGCSTEAELGDAAGAAWGCAGAGPDRDASDGEVEEDGAGPEEPVEGEAQPSPGAPPGSSLVPGAVPEVPPPSVASLEGTRATPEETGDSLEGTGAALAGTEASPEETSATPEGTGATPEGTRASAEGSGATPEGTGASPGSSPASPSLSASSPALCHAPPDLPAPLQAAPLASPGPPAPVPVVLRCDGSAPARLAARTVRVQLARSVPVVPPKPQFARIPSAVEADASAVAPEGPPPPSAGGGARRAGWREGGSASFDAAVAVAARQPPSQAPMRRIQTYGGGELVPAAAPAAAAASPTKALPFQKAPLRPRLLRPLSCSAAPEAEAPGRGQTGPSRPLVQAEGAALAPPRRPVGTEGAAGQG